MAAVRRAVTMVCGSESGTWDDQAEPPSSEEESSGSGSSSSSSSGNQKEKETIASNTATAEAAATATAEAEAAAAAAAAAVTAAEAAASSSRLPQEVVKVADKLAVGRCKSEPGLTALGFSGISA